MAITLPGIWKWRQIEIGFDLPAADPVTGAVLQCCPVDHLRFSMNQVMFIKKCLGVTLEPGFI